MSVLEEPDELQQYDRPVVTAGSGSAMHRPSTEIVPGPACHNYGSEWGRIVEYDLIHAFREWCQCAQCQEYRKEIEEDL